jgi:hypothetical protein
VEADENERAGSANRGPEKDQAEHLTTLECALLGQLAAGALINRESAAAIEWHSMRFALQGMLTGRIRLPVLSAG